MLTQAWNGKNGAKYLPFRHFNDIFHGRCSQIVDKIIAKEKKRASQLVRLVSSLLLLSPFFFGNFEEYLEFLCHKIFFLLHLSHTKQLADVCSNIKKETTNNTLSTSDVTFFHDFYKTFPCYAQFVNVITTRNEKKAILAHGER